MAIREPEVIQEASVDEKGRLKIPVEFAEYLRAFGGGNKLYITSLDRRLGIVYPDPVWRENLNLASEKATPDVARNLSFRAQSFGGPAEMEDSGRVMLPANLRTTLGIKGKAEVRLHAFGGTVRILTPQIFEEEMRKSDERFNRDMEELNRVGFK